MNLDFQPLEGREDLVAPAVAEFVQKQGLSQTVKVARINPDFADGELLSKEYDIPYKMEVNCLVVEGSRGEDKKYAALLVPYGKRAKTNATVKRPLDASKIHFADLEVVLEMTGMEFGSITPLGLPDDWKILVDSSLLEQEKLVIGGGLVTSKLLLPAEVLVSLAQAEVIEGLAKD
ncbi:YbaK/EbsC family protein [Streptococcus sobrinus]|uniref:YbaK/EbsC family protein n=1 Tax=Streptococcus sobrinus TaxID=1310 RepID=UPI00030E64BA|nr:YbaK/EbsC family protein [Streptococcus sobrinus]AWN19021.1 proline--tRNA ligase [Streptococcus sobrinus]